MRIFVVSKLCLTTFIYVWYTWIPSSTGCLRFCKLCSHALRNGYEPHDMIVSCCPSLHWGTLNRCSSYEQGGSSTVFPTSHQVIITSCSMKRRLDLEREQIGLLYWTTQANQRPTVRLGRILTHNSSLAPRPSTYIKCLNLLFLLYWAEFLSVR